MNCPHCHAGLASDARFCGACGKVLVPTGPEAAITDPMAAMIGREIGGRYRILAKLGEGGMGAVFRAEQIALRRTVAVKLLRPEIVSSPLLLRRFNAEAEVVAKLSHPNTVIIYDFGQDPDGTLFIAMEYIDGRSLRSALHAEGPFPLHRALAIAGQVAASLVDAHAHSIVHRDLKPDNVMLQDRGKLRDVVRVLDFGIAKLRDESRATALAMTQAGDLLGTPQYMAPEQIKGEPIDGRTDVYALGCMMYEMVTNRMPFEAQTVMAMLSKHLLEAVVPPSQCRPELGLPPAVDQLVLTAMAKDPRARFATMEALGDQIAALLVALPPDPARGGTGQVASTLPVPAPTPAPLLTPMAPAPAVPIATSPGRATPATTPAPRPRTALYAAIAAVVVGAGGLVAWQATRSSVVHDKPAPRPAPPPDAAPPAPDPDDPWPAKARVDKPSAASAPSTPSTDDAITAALHAVTGGNGTGGGLTLPLGASMTAPPGFELEERAEGIAVVDTKHHVAMVLFPLAPSTDSAETQAKSYARIMKLDYQGLTQVTSHGGQRVMAGFSGTNANGKFAEVVIAYVTPAYSVALAVVAPAATAKTKTFQDWLDTAVEQDLVLP